MIVSFIKQDVRNHCLARLWKYHQYAGKKSQNVMAEKSTQSCS